MDTIDLVKEQQDQEQESDKPPSGRGRNGRSGRHRPHGRGSHGSRPYWRVAVIANVKEEPASGEAHHSGAGPADAGAEYDRMETIQAIMGAIGSDGHYPIFLPADRRLPAALQEIHPDICFNIAEGAGNDGREAHVPALLAMLGIPYTASGVLANAISLEKTMTKRLWRDARLPIAPFQEFILGDEPLRPGLRFPLFVKPAREGTGMGVGLEAKVHDEAELRRRVDWVLDTYRQPALVETFLPGREFTVGVLGRAGAGRFARRQELYGADGYHRFPILEIESQRSVTPGVYGHDAKSKALADQGAPAYLCPADVEPGLAEKLHRLALRGHQAIGALDVSRVDFRLDQEGNPCLLEINTLPGLNPEISDLCIMSAAEDLPYTDLILEILTLAAIRYHLIGEVENHRYAGAGVYSVTGRG
jgi:D-alanine-D-alanine ligase